MMEDKRIVSYCGIMCSQCPAYIATQKNDDNMRQEMAEKWSKMYDAEIKPEYVNCDGCSSESDLRIDYTNECAIRLCGIEKGVSNCACCDDYACDKLKPIFDSYPTSKSTLDEIRNNMR
ncbi:MAG: DUF3795 domain-containing protein [bacterium]